MPCVGYPLLQVATNATLWSKTLWQNCVRCINRKWWCKKRSKKMQNVCDGGAIKHGSNFRCACDAGHAVDPSELRWGRTTETGSHINVCAIYGIQFAPMNCLLLGSATETVSQIKVCVIYGIRFTRTNYFWLGNTTEMVQLNKMCVIRAKQPTRMNCLRWEITTQTVNTVSSCAILCVQKTLKNAN